MIQIFGYIIWIAECIHILYLANRWHQDTLWQEIKLIEAV